MIDHNLFLSMAQKIASEKQKYALRHDGSDGECDCIGLVIGAIRRAGGTWSGIHGSNYAARNEMESLTKIVGTPDLQAGYLVYKAAEPGTKKWRLPARYKNSEDQRDYYHVGIVVSVNPTRILHMTTPTTKIDTSIGQWSWTGKLKMVDYTGDNRRDEETMETRIIRGGNESRGINMRAAASTGSKLLQIIPQGSTVDLMESGGTWSRIKFNGIEGWVMTKFVQGEPETPADEQAGELVPDMLRIKDELIQVDMHINTLWELLGGRG